MTDRIDLERQIIDCWQITDEIPMMEAQGANSADMTSLACVYEFKFKQLWSTFQTMVDENQFKDRAAYAAVSGMQEQFAFE
jgi:hypothetical protein